MERENNNFLLFALETLARATKLEASELIEVMDSPSYKIFAIPKRSGGKRKICAPVNKTKKVLNSIYYNFLRKIYTGLSIDKNCFGGIPKKSTKNCINAHTFQVKDFLIDIDIKDAFHCVNENTLHESIKFLLYEEIFMYWYRYIHYMEVNLSEESSIEDFKKEIFRKKINELYNFDEYSSYLESSKFYGRYGSKILSDSKRQILFPNRTCKAFRQMIREENPTKVLKVCDLMAAILTKICIFEGKMRQGSPTSPILMALAISHTKLLDQFNEYRLKTPPSFPSEFTGFSVYVDNIAISVKSFKTKAEISDELRILISKINSNTNWNFNWNKIHIYDCSKENPIILGVRLVRNKHTRQELKVMSKDKIKGATHALNAWEPWFYYKPTLPKEMQNKIRSAIHYALLDDEDDKHIQGKARGYIGYVFQIYEDIKNIPSKIRKPIEEFLKKQKKSA